MSRVAEISSTSLSLLCGARGLGWAWWGAETAGGRCSFQHLEQSLSTGVLRGYLFWEEEEAGIWHPWLHLGGGAGTRGGAQNRVRGAGDCRQGAKAETAGGGGGTSSPRGKQKNGPSS